MPISSVLRRLNFLAEEGAGQSLVFSTRESLHVSKFQVVLLNTANSKTAILKNRPKHTSKRACYHKFLLQVN